MCLGKSSPQAGNLGVSALIQLWFQQNPNGFSQSWLPFWRAWAREDSAEGPFP